MLSHQDRPGVGRRLRHDGTGLSRRGFLAKTAALAATAVAVPAIVRAAEGGRSDRAAVIGHTGRGDYGHGLDVVWADVPGVELVAVADADPQGLAAAAKTLKVAKAYPDYRRMLDEVKPDLATIATRWVDQHHDMLLAAAERGVRGVYMDKPLARTLAEADAMIAACQQHKMLSAVAFQTCYSPRLPVVAELIRSGGDFHMRQGAATEIQFGLQLHRGRTAAMTAATPGKVVLHFLGQGDRGTIQQTPAVMHRQPWL